MNRTILIIALVCLSASVMASKPDKAADDKKDHPQQEVKAAPALDGSPYPAAHAQETNDDPPHWYASIKRPEWCLVAVAILTCIVVGWQAWETRSAAEATRDSFRLQEAAMKQWVDMEGWNVSERYKEGEFYEWNFRFDLVNRTKLPLTIREVHVTIQGQQSITRQSNVVAPDQKYAVQAPLTVNKESFGDIRSNTLLILEFTCLVVFVDALRKRQGQPFEGWISCQRHQVNFSVVQPVQGE